MSRKMTLKGFFRSRVLLVFLQMKKSPTVLLRGQQGSSYCPECSATGMGQFPICKLKWDLLRTSVTACTIDENTFSAPFGIFYVRMEI